MLRHLYAKSLSDIFSNLKSKYRNNQFYSIDEHNLFCSVTEYTSPKKMYIASACCATDDHELKGFDTGNTATIYRSGKFKSKVEAMAHLEKEVRKATQKHPETKFYRTKVVVFEGEEVIQYEYCLNGVWSDCDPPWT